MSARHLLVVFLSVLFGGSTATANPHWQDDEIAPNSDQQDDAKSPADEAFEPLGRDLKNLYESLRGKGGVEPADHPIIKAVRDRAADFSRQFPDDLRGPAAELTLSQWLDDQQRVQQLYDVLLTMAPDKAEIRRDWAQRLKAENKYAQAIDVLRKREIDPAKNPDMVILLSDCLFGENRFQESLDALNSIPESVFTEMEHIKSQVDSLRPIREQYIELWKTEESLRAQEESANDLPRVLLTTDKGTILLELFEDHAPNTVANFISLIDQAFYNGTKFHRVIANFMSQGGDPNSREGGDATKVGQGNPGYYIPDEVNRDDHRKHFAGSLAMAKVDAPNTAGCQFYITHAPTQWLNGKHTVFGRVIDGLDVARAIEQDDVIQSITILRKRDHGYAPNTLPLTGAATRPVAPPATPTAPPATTQPGGTLIPIPPPTTQPSRDDIDDQPE